MPRVFITLAALCCSVTYSSNLLAQKASDMDAWLNLEIQKSKIESDWIERKVLLDQQLFLHETKQTELQNKIDINQATQDDAEERRVMVTGELADLKESQAQLASTLDQYIFRLNSLIESLPPPLAESISGKLATMNDNTVTLTDKLTALIDNLKKINDFSESYSKTDGAIAVNGQPPLHVTQIYMGLAFAWYISDDHQTYGVGHPTAAGWQWIPAQDTGSALGMEVNAQDIKTLSDMLNNPDGSQFVYMPFATGN